MSMEPFNVGASSPVIFAHVRLDGTVVSCHFPTPEVLSLSSWKEGSAFCEMPWWLANSSVPDIQSLIDSAAAGQSASIQNVRYQSTLGETRVLELWAHPFNRMDQRFDTAVITGTDTTSFSQHIDALTVSETKFREMSHALPALVWMHDSEGRHEFANQTFCDFFNVTQEELQGDKWQMLVHPEDTHYAELFYESFQQKKPFHAEVRARNVANEWRQLESFATPHFLSDGSFNGYVGVTVDITDRKAALESLTDEAHKKNVFLATLAHELRNPLLPVLMGSELLQLDESISGDSKNTIQTIHRQAIQLERLIDDILDINRLDQGEFSIRPAAICMQGVIDSVIENLRARITDKGHKLQVTCATPRSMWVWGDEIRLIQALTNVISNAIRCTPQNGELQVVVAANETHCEVSVIDNGPGIPLEEIDHIFDLYYSTHTESTRGEISLGIGLWLAKSILQKHGGSIIALRKEYGSGATFQLTVPLASKAQLALAEPSTQPSNHAHIEKPLRVVIVEDNNVVASTLASAIKRLGGVPHTESNADGIVNIINSFKADIVLLDIGLPTISGIQAALQIRKELGSNSPKLVALSGWSDEHHMKSAEEAGFDRYMVKPVTLKEIKQLFANTPL